MRLSQRSPAAVRESLFRYTESGWVSADRQQASSAIYFDIHAAPGPAPDGAAASGAVICLELTR